MFDNEGVLITDPKRILQEIQTFYSNLCKRDPPRRSEDILNFFLNISEIPKVTNDEARICDGKLRVDECCKSLQLFESNKSPGNDGLMAEFYRVFWHTLRNLPLDILRLISVIDALPEEWHESLNTFASIADKPFNLHNDFKLSFNGKSVLIETVFSKTVYKELCNRVITPLIAQLNFNTDFANDVLEWKEIYSLSFRTSLDTKSREFQYKLLNRCLVTDSFLSKIGIIPSPACSFSVVK